MTHSGSYWAVACFQQTYRSRVFNRSNRTRAAQSVWALTGGELQAAAFELHRHVDAVTHSSALIPGLADPSALNTALNKGCAAVHVQERS